MKKNISKIKSKKIQKNPKKIHKKNSKFLKMSKIVKNSKNLFFLNPKFLKNIFFKEKISSLLLNIRNMRFDQSFSVQPNPEKKI